MTVNVQATRKKEGERSRSRLSKKLTRTPNSRVINFERRTKKKLLFSLHATKKEKLLLKPTPVMMTPLLMTTPPFQP